MTALLQRFMTLAVNPVFPLLVSRTRRIVFITATYLFFALSLLGFYIVLVSAPQTIGEVSGMVFFVWFSVFNLFAALGTDLGFVGLAISASLAAVIVLQAAFSAMQRAIIRPARETLFTIVPREDKYKAKAFIDTFVYRVGDAVGAQVEGLLGRLAMGLTALVAVTVPLAVVWGILGVWLGRAQHRRVTQGSAPAARGVRREEAVAV